MEQKSACTQNVRPALLCCGLSCSKSSDASPPPRLTSSSVSADGRTWGLAAIGARRRLTMALLPIMYKMGVGTTLLGVLVFLALKTMFMVSILFVLAVGSFFKHKLGGFGHHPPPYAHYAPPPQQKEVHVHVHADPHKQVSGARRLGGRQPHCSGALRAGLPRARQGRRCAPHARERRLPPLPRLRGAREVRA